ncbi:hypothetical protein QFC19_001257 [Naganishia cerealis]|uniref:Uncharacterized protein n=1 Tax=Naganishia cerealis TaxID=610337 RepID=A0ACC2WIP7_9TREE|nr:hypothetical protein QFC19_001257 [Naganishia cerealis]
MQGSTPTNNADASSAATISAAPQPAAGTPQSGVGMISPAGAAAYGMQPVMGFGGQGTMQEQQRRAHLYVGNLSPRVTEYMLTEIFAVAGPVANAKIIPDRNYTHGGLNFGFVEYSDMRSAEQALNTLNGRKIFDTEIRVNWAYQNQGAGVGGLPGQPREDTQNHYHVFVGDLSPEVNDEALGKAFGAFGTLSEARVMWDMNSGKSRGYGFLAFREKADAEQAIATMNGEWLGSRAIRVNWANQKTQTGGRGGPGGFGGGVGGGSSMGGAPPAAAPLPSGGGMPMTGGYSGGGNDYETVVAQTPAYNTTVYVGNLIPYSTQADLIPLFQGYGYIVEIRMQADRGFAFVKLDTHEHAAQAICNLQNYQVHGRPIKCSWGKDREGGATAGVGAVNAGASPAMGMGMPAPGAMQQPGAMNMGMMGYNPMMQQQMYGMPPQNYAQYYPGYDYMGMASPGAGGAAPGTGIAGQPAAATPDASAQHAAGQPGWGGQDPAAAAAYYQQAAAAGNQWGAYYGGQAAQPGQPGQQR